MANEVKLSFSGDASGANKAIDSIERNLDGMDDGLRGTAGKVRDFDQSLDGVTGGLENTTGKLRGTNDLISGFAGVVGLSLPPQADMIMGFADMADGLAVVLGPALKSAMGAMKALNLTFLTSPIGLTIAAVVALGAAMVIAYKKSETFRRIVDGAFTKAKEVASSFVELVKDGAELLVLPYKTAFNGIAWAWNNTIGALSFKLPGWIPGIGGNGFDVPDMPTFANGGRFQPGWKMVGERGPELMYTDGAGGIVPRNQLGGGGGATRVVVEFRGDGAFVEAVRKTARVYGGGDVQKAFGGR